MPEVAVVVRVVLAAFPSGAGQGPARSTNVEARGGAVARMGSRHPLASPKRLGFVRTDSRSFPRVRFWRRTTALGSPPEGSAVHRGPPQPGAAPLRTAHCPPRSPRPQRDPRRTNAGSPQVFRLLVPPSGAAPRLLAAGRLRLRPVLGRGGAEAERRGCGRRLPLCSRPLRGSAGPAGARCSWALTSLL